MALPASVSGVSFGSGTPAPVGICGARLSSSGNVYFLVRNDTSDDLVAYKASDPESGFSSVDSVDLSILQYIALRQEGDTLHIVYAGGSNGWFYVQFSMSTDAFSTPVFIGDMPNILGTGDIERRADGDLVTIYNGPVQGIMGLNYYRTYYSVSTNNGANWSTPAAFDAAGKDRAFDQLYPKCALGDSDTIHGVWINNGEFYQRALSSADALQTERATSQSATVVYSPLRFIRSSTTKLRFAGGTTSVNILKFDAAADPSSFSSDTVAAHTHPSIVADGDLVYLVAAATSDGDIDTANDQSSDSWTTPAQFGSATSVDAINAAIYTRSGTKVLAILYWISGSGVFYDEFSLTAGITVNVSAAIEGNDSLAVAIKKLEAVTLSTEADAGRPANLTRVGYAGRADEVDIGQVVAISKLTGVKIIVSIIIGSDDARELISTGNMTRFNSSEPIRSQRLLAFRFTGFDLTGKICTGAYIQFTAAVTDTGTNETIIWCEASTNPPTMSGDAFDISNRTKTTANVTFAFGAWTANDRTSAQLTPNLATIVNEAIAAGSLTSLVFIVHATTGLDGDREPAMFDHATLQEATLSLEFAVVPVGLAAETDVALVATVLAPIIAEAAVSTEVDAGLTVSLSKLVDAALSSETDVSQAVDLAKRLGIAICLEVDAGLPSDVSKTALVALSSEASNALSVLLNKISNIAIGTEADTGLVVDLSKNLSVALSSETDLGLVVSSGKYVFGAVSTEANAGLAALLSKVLNVDISSEVSVSLAINLIKTIDAVLSSEANAGLAATTAKNLNVPLSSEIDLGLAIDLDKLASIAISTEQDNSLNVDLAKQVAVTLGSEQDSGRSVTLAKNLSVSLSSEVDLGLAVAVAGQIIASAGRAAEADVALGSSIAKLIGVSLGTEADTARPVALSKLTGVVRADEVNFSLATTLQKLFGVSVSSSVETGLNTTISKIVDVPISVELSAAQVAFLTKRAGVSLSSEIDFGLTSVAAIASKAFAASAIEIDFGQIVQGLKRADISLSTDSELGLAAITSLVQGVTLASEIDLSLTADALVEQQATAVLATEQDVAEIVALMKLAAIDLSDETDLGLAVASGRAFSIDPSLSSNTSLGIITSKLIGVQVAIEIDGAILIVPITTLPYLKAPFKLVGVYDGSSFAKGSEGWAQVLGTSGLSSVKGLDGIRYVRGLSGKSRIVE